MNDRLNPETAALHALPQLFDAQRRAFAADIDPALPVRLDRLDRLARMTDRIAAPLARAISDDFGQRPAQVTQLSDVLIVQSAIRHARRRLAGWMRPRRVATSLAFLPGSSRIHPQPLGVVGIVSPWNYPFQLAMGPAVSALAAGNRVLVKPSEHTPRCAALLAQAVAADFDPGELAVVQGGADVARAFVALPFDHLLYTGSAAVGRQVALAAAANLTPLTLELGGKSPAIVSAGCDLAQAVPRLLIGKLVNAGQTCVAPDYVLLHASLADAFVAAMRDWTARYFATIAGNPDVTSLCGDRQQTRMEALLADALAQGARAVPLHAETETRQRLMPPQLLFDVDDRMQVMQQEIFGPLLPVLTYSDIDDAIGYVNRHDRPLALYWFGSDAAERDRVLRRTHSGGVTVNDCLWHVAQDALPFGGVGASGHGRYHGVHGFETFSHLKAVFHQSRHAGQRLLAPPYGPGFDRLARWVGRLL